MIDPAEMAERYRNARDLFLSNARLAKWEICSIPHPLQGPCEIDLFTDVA